MPHQIALDSRRLQGGIFCSTTASTNANSTSSSTAPVLCKLKASAGGRRKDTYDHGLSGELESKSDGVKTKQNKERWAATGYKIKHYYMYLVYTYNSRGY